jgi:hypothetical protein
MMVESLLHGFVGCFLARDFNCRCLGRDGGGSVRRVPFLVLLIRIV